MDESEQFRLTRSGFNEILAGYTPFIFGRDSLYLKHFGSRDQIEVDQIYKSHFDRICKSGVPTSYQKSAELADNGLWTSEDEDRLTNKKKEIDALQQGKRLLFLKTDIDAQQATIDRAETEYYLEIVRKNNLFGKTAEFFANKRVSDYCVVNSIYRDREFTKPYFDIKDVFELDDETMTLITNSYNEAVAKFEEKNLKKIALSHLFQNYFFLAKSVYEFYGRAISNLTFYQVQLVTFGEHYKSILFGDNKPPEEVAGDPEKLEEWLTGSAHARKVMDNTLGENTEGEGTTFTTIVGAKSEDLEYVGIKTDQGGDTMSLADKVKENGGHLNKEELMKLMGIG